MAVNDNYGLNRNVIPNALNNTGVPSVLQSSSSLAGSSNTGLPVQDDANSVSTELASQIQRLESSTASQEARVMASAGPEVLQEYENDKAKEKKGLITTVLDLLDTPRNTIFVGLKEAMDSGDLVGGLLKGITRSEVYSGYDLAEDIGFDGISKAAVGFAAEVVLDPANYFSFGLSSLFKGFFNGAVTDAGKAVGSTYLKEVAGEAASKAATEGAEAIAGTITSEAAKAAASKGVKETAEQVGKATVKNATAEATEDIVSKNAKGFLGKLNEKLETIASKAGLKYGPGKTEALFYGAKKEISEMGRLMNGTNIASDVLDLAKAGNYGEDVQKLAETYEAARLAYTTANTTATTKMAKEALDNAKEPLLEALRSHIIDLRVDIFNARKIDGDAIRKATEELYNSSVSSGYQALMSQLKVSTLDEVKEVMGKELGREATDADVLYKIYENVFGDAITGMITKKAKASTSALQNIAMDSLLDYEATLQIYPQLLKENASRIGKAFRVEIPFTNIGKDIADAKTLYEIGSKARTAISYTIDASGKIKRTAIGTALDTADTMVRKVFGRIPLLSSLFDKDKAWALKILENDKRFSTNLATKKAETKIGDMYKVLSGAGFKTKEEINDVGDFISTAIESQKLTKNSTNADWRNIIEGFEEIDPANLDNIVTDRMGSIITELQEKGTTDGLYSFIDEATNTVDTESEAFKEWYKNTEAGLRKSLELQSDIKSRFMKLDTKKQDAVLEVTRSIAEDLDNLGKELADRGLIPDERMLSAEYWYFPHKLSLDLMMNRLGSDTEDVIESIAPGYRSVLGGVKENLTIKDAATWARKYPMSVKAANDILYQKYGIRDMLETNAFNTYMLYAIEQNKVLADSEFVNGVLEEFGIKCVTPDIANALRSRGYSIVVQSGSIDALVLDEQTIHFMQTGLSGKIDEINNNIKIINKLNKQMSDINATFSDVAKDSIRRTAEAKAINSKLQDARKRIKSLLKDANVELPDGIDDDTFAEVIDYALNDTFVKHNGDNIYRTATMGNVQFREANALNVLKDEKGIPYTAVGKLDDINGGYRILTNPDATDIAEGYIKVHIISKKPYELDASLYKESTSVQDMLNNIPADVLEKVKGEGYDSVIFNSKGNRIVVPFDDNQVYSTNRLQEYINTGKRYAKYKSNTKNGGYIAVDPSKVFKADDEIIKVSDLTFRQRKELKDLVNNDYLRIEGANKEKSKVLTKLYNEVDTLQEQLASLDTDLQGLDPVKDATKITRIEAQIREKEHILARRNTEAYNLQKQLNSSEISEEYKFIAALSGKAGYKDASITRSQLSGMLGSNRKTGLQILGYEAIDAGIDANTGKQIYEQLPNAKYYVSKAELSAWFEDKIIKIKQNDELRGIYEILSDDGSGKDPIAHMIEVLNSKKYTSTEAKLKSKIEKFAKDSTRVFTDESGNKVRTPINTMKNLTDRQKTLIARILSGNGVLYNVTDPDDVRELYSLFDGGIGISKTRGNIYAIPTDILNTVNKGYEKKTKSDIQGLRQLLLKFNKIWKPSVTSWRPSFSARNLASGYFNSFMELGSKVFDADVTEAAYKMVLGKDLDEVIKIGNIEMTVGQLRDEMIKRGATNTFTSTDISSLDKALGEQMRKAIDPSFASKVKHPLRTMEQFSESTENYNRCLAFMASLKSGHGLDTAGEIVRNTQFDYADLSDMEKQIKKFLPFYTWLRNNTKFMLEKFLDDPRWFIAVMRRLPEFTRQVSGMSDEDYENTPDWIKETYPLTLGYNAETQRYTLFDPSLPYQDLNKIGGPSTMMDTVMELLHPVIKTPLELWLNKNLYTGAALESYTGETAEKAIQGTANPVLNAIAKISPNTLRNMPGLTEAANEILNQFGVVRDLQYLNGESGTNKSGTIYSSKSVSHTNIALVNLLENALLDTNQLKYYSAASGYKDALYQKSRDLSNLIQKLGDQGYEVPSSSEVSSLANKIVKLNSKGGTIARNAVEQRGATNTSLSSAVSNSLQFFGYTGIEGGNVSGSILQGKQRANGNVSSSILRGHNNREANGLARGADKIITFGNGTYIDEEGNEVSKDAIYKGTWGKSKMTADDGTMYQEFITTKGEVYYLNPQEINLVAWQESNTFEEEVEAYRQAYEEYKALPNDKKPDTWYSLNRNDGHYELAIYNQMIKSNFDSKKLREWFLQHPNYIPWKQVATSKE